MNITQAIGPIIVIDDDQGMRRACDATLSRAGYTVETYADGEAGLKRVNEIHPAIVVTDLKMPGIGGIEVIQHVREIDPDIVVIVITGFATVSTAVDAMKSGAYDFVPKPFVAEELRVIVRRAAERWFLSQEAKRLQAEKAAQARKFITFVSHQLQSPLGAVRQYLDVLAYKCGDQLPEEPRKWVDRSRIKIAEMLQIISDWLTFSKVESGQLATQRDPVELAALIGATLEDFTATASERHIEIRQQISAPLPPVIGDEAALRMLLSNLVSNALKYSRADGHVTVTAAAAGDHVELAVADAGIGIAPDQLPHIFEEFYRVRDGSTDGIGGTGMGLPICRRIAEEHGGTIDVTSAVEEGTTFTVALPCAPSPETTSHSVTAEG